MSDPSVVWACVVVVVPGPVLGLGCEEEGREEEERRGVGVKSVLRKGRGAAEGEKNV